MTYQASTGSLILDYQLNLYSTPLTTADAAGARKLVWQGRAMVGQIIVYAERL